MTRSTRAGRAVLGLLVAVLAVAACAAAAGTPAGIQNGNPVAPSVSASSPSSVSGASLPPAAGRVPAALRGTYSAAVNGTTASSGVWILELTATDVFLTNPRGGDPFSIDVSAINATELMVDPAPDCPDQTTVTDGKYAISLKGDQLTFVADHDSCGDRKATLTTTAWTRKP